MKIKTFQQSDVMGSNFNFWCEGSVPEIPFDKKIYMLLLKGTFIYYESLWFL